MSKNKKKKNKTPFFLRWIIKFYRINFTPDPRACVSLATQALHAQRHQQKTSIKTL